MLVIDVENELDLENTLTCGQIFRYQQEIDNSFTVVISDRVVNLKYDNYKLYVKSNKLDNLENVIREYLDLDRDYKSIINKIRVMDDILAKYLDNSLGLKMIKQDKLECIISYIISQNNSVRNIQMSLNMLSEAYGEKVEFLNKEYYLFPKLDKLVSLSLEDFRKCKVGFRDKYLVGIIESINNGNFNLNMIDTLNTEEALQYLINFKGIGMKVASCILLFSYQRFDVYPVDTWVKKFMEDNYDIVGEKNIREYCKKTYGEYSGLAIQYMFNSKRNMNV